MNTAAGSGVTAVALETAADPLGEFGSESSDGTAPRDTGAGAAIKRRNRLTWTLSVLALAQMPFVTLWLMGSSLPIGRQDALVHVDSAPAGAEVRMDGRVLGVTPIALSLAAGDRLLEVEYGDIVRQLPVTVRAGEVMRQRIEFLGATAAAPAVTLGALSVTTEPARAAAVFVDGTAQGTSPVLVSNLAPGDHAVSVRFPTGTVERTIRVAAGSTASFIAAMPAAAGAVSGWITVDVGLPMRILEQGRLVGTTDIERLMLPAGDHMLEFVSDELGFRAIRRVRVSPGATSTVSLDLPRAPLAINAQPWASVWVDGEAVGDTPIGNLSTTVGRHDIVFRHPELGERRASVVVTLKSPARIGVDLRRTN
jgi:hypothetical protein